MNERERIELLMKCYELSPSQFADKVGIQRASVSHIISGRNKPSLEVMLKIYDAFPGIDMKWLMTGTGDEPVVGRGALATPAAMRQDVVPVTAVATHQLSNGSEESLFAVSDFVVNDAPVQKPVSKPQQQSVPKNGVERQYRRNVASRSSVAQQSMPVRKIKEIRVYYTDGTYEIMYPEK